MIDPPDELLSLPTPEGRAPESRLTEAKDLRKILTRYVKDDRGRSIQRALVRGNLDGNPPYGSARRKGLEWTANVNFMAAKARLRAAQQPYNALFAGVQTYAICRTAYQPHNPDREKWNDSITCNFHKMIKTWKGFDWHMQHRVKEMLTEGWGPVVFDKDGDWRFRAIRAASVRVAKDSPSTVDERIACILVSVPYRVHELYAKIADEAHAKMLGWNIEATQFAIRNHSRSVGGNNWATAPWEYWQRKFQHHDLATGEAESDVVYCTHGYVQEFDKKGQKKKISHFIVTDSDQNAPTDRENGFLFRNVRRYESYSQALIVYFLDIGDGDWASVRGLAFDSFKHDVLINRLLCRIADGAFLSSSIVLGAATQKEREKQQLAVIGPVTWLPAGAQIPQQKITGDLNAVIEASRLFTNDQAQHLQNYNAGSVSPEPEQGRERVTAFEVSQRVQKNSTLSGDQITLDCLTSDRLFDEIFRRAADPSTQDKEATAFQEACFADGVPKEALSNMECVYMNRLSGYGSAQMRAITTQQLMQVAPSLPEEGKDNLLNDYIVATTQNPSLAERYNPPQPKPTPDDALVVLENAAIQAGEIPVIFSGQNHVGHLQGHLADTAQKLGPLQEAMDAGQSDPAELEQAYAYLQVMGPHLEAHLQPLEADPMRKQLAKQFRVQLKNIASFHGKLRQEIRKARSEAEQAQMEQQNANALGALTQAKLDASETDQRIKIAKAQNDMNLKRVKTGQSQALKTWQVQQNTRLDAVKTAHELQMQNAKASNGSEE
jgi:hypothetical protein